MSQPGRVSTCGAVGAWEGPALVRGGSRAEWCRPLYGALRMGERETSIARGAHLRKLEAAQRALYDALASGDAERASQARAALARAERLPSTAAASLLGSTPYGGAGRGQH